MRRPIVTDIKRTGRGEGIPFMLTGVVIDTRAGAGMCRVRLDNLSRRTIKNVIIPTGAGLQSGDRVLLANLGHDPKWIIITRVQEGSDLGQHLSPTDQGTTQLHPPNNFTVTGIDGAVKAEWDCWAGNSICWDVQHNDSATDVGASTRYTRGSYFFYFNTTPVTRYIRVRAVRYDVELNQAYYSGWSAWTSATSTEDSGTVDGFHASATPTANWLLALDSNAQWPSEVVPSMLGPHTIGGHTNRINIDSAGDLTLEGTARVTVDLYVNASGVKAPGGHPATFVESGLTGVWQFADVVVGNQESISGTLKLPTQMDKAVVPIFRVGWSANGVSPGDCEWQLEYLYLAPGDDTTAVAQDTKAKTGTASGTSNGFVITSFAALDLPGATDQAMLFKITRLSADPKDTIAVTVELRGMMFTHTRNRLGTAT